MEKKNNKSRTAIAWTDLTMTVQSLIRKPKVILNRLNGYAEFGSVTAVMGPSGAGLTSLLKCLNGINNSYLSEDTKIRLTSNEKIRSSFIGHNEKEFLVMPLTAKQNMIYASKLKNSDIDEDIDHESHVKQIMNDLLIGDTMDTKAENCSGGEQKRLAVALELTALHKPNLILCDEPTTGLDSNVAEVVVQCIRDLAIKHKICIITSIHQPNSDVLQMLDQLYVLAKGGVCVYSGCPQSLTQHLRECDIVCNAYQVPIEHLVTIGSKGLEDNSVVKLVNKTNENFKQNYRSVIKRTKLKRIEPKSKPFSFKDLKILLMRAVTIVRYYEWRVIATTMTSFILAGFLIIWAFDKYVGVEDGCISFTSPDSRSCFELLSSDNSLEQNFSFLFVIGWVSQLMQIITSTTFLDHKYKRFRNEHQNMWYSSGVYYVCQMLMDAIPTTVSTLICGTMAFKMTHQKDEAKRFWSVLSTFLLSSHLVESFAYFFTFAIANTELRLVCAFFVVIAASLLSGFTMQVEDLPNLIDLISNLTSMRFILSPLIVAIYGFDRCPKNMTSQMMFKFGLDDDIYAEYTAYSITQLVLYRIFALILLVVTTNMMYYHKTKNYIKLKIFNKDHKSTQLNTSYNPVCYDNPVVVDVESQDSESDSNEESEESEAESSSLYCSVFSNDSEIYEKEENDHGLSIGWVDLTLKVEKTFYSNEKLILRGIKGFIRFGALTALMGPSGAGKTSLLRALNGMYKTLMTKESKILLSNSRKINTCFIAQDQREHIINGLSVYQTLLYASKLKNIGLNVDHDFNIKKLMNELMIIDIKNKSVHKCSAGQQKRIVMAMELTAEVKPNLICVDEPTSGVDSYSALLMIKCFKTISESHSLSIITSIHQPSLEILMLYDMLYVLAKGGITVFSGRPQRLRRHLNECQIFLDENQLPIEVLLKIGARGYNDEKVLQLSAKTNEVLEQYENKMIKELVYCPNGIPVKNKKFSFEELYLLFIRTVIYTIRYNWVLMVGLGVIIVSFVSGVRYMFSDFDLSASKGCVSTVINDTNGCVRSPEQLEASKLNRYNTFYILFTTCVPMFLHFLAAAINTRSDIKIFLMENRNKWYSCESYFLVKLVLENIQVIPLTLIVGIIIVADIYDEDNMYLAICFVVYFMINHAQAIGVILGTCLDQSLAGGLNLFILFFLVYVDQIIPSYEFDRMMLVPSVLVSPPKWALQYIYVWYYGDKCKGDDVSALLYKFKIDPNDDQDKSLVTLVLATIAMRIASYLCIKIRANYDTIKIKLNEFAERLRRDL